MFYKYSDTNSLEHTTLQHEVQHPSLTLECSDRDTPCNSYCCVCMVLTLLLHRYPIRLEGRLSPWPVLCMMVCVSGNHFCVQSPRPHLHDSCVLYSVSCFKPINPPVASAAFTFCAPSLTTAAAPRHPVKLCCLHPMNGLLSGRMHFREDRWYKAGFGSRSHSNLCFFMSGV